MKGTPSIADCAGFMLTMLMSLLFGMLGITGLMLITTPIMVPVLVFSQGESLWWLTLIPASLVAAPVLMWVGISGLEYAGSRLHP